MKPTRLTSPQRRTVLLLAGAALLGAGRAVSASTPPPEVAEALPQARLQGSGRLRFLGLRVYDARLWVAGPPVADTPDGWHALPLALELQYLRRLVGRQIAERSLEEMRRQAEIAPADAERWLAAMKQIFPDVVDGDRLTGLHLPGQGLRFLFNGQLRGEVMEPAFARLFLGIWLSPRTSEPALRAALLGRG
jgi:hypothetical protein